ncbi:MAG TPA: hypothetical protein DDY11_10980 [Leclercia adecarboxylata]|nr:hypothetical protein [Leclercia adecarboxylata]QBF89232.1 hypothetical protein EXN74_02345 [Leclercia adecarboxylata]QFH52180.1 hypothetical protein FR819_00585 [Leclercia adecarboxylata]QFH67331.1 hypothetical protein FR773_00570 [Leclercia adecarboxylata]QGP86049.1 hypothetical protein GLX29_00570 [Leclercia adecarboxylata]
MPALSQRRGYFLFGRGLG